MAIDFARLATDPDYKFVLQNDDGRDGQQYRKMLREGTLPTLAPQGTGAPASVVPNADNIGNFGAMPAGVLFSNHPSTAGNGWGTLGPDLYQRSQDSEDPGNKLVHDTPDVVSIGGTEFHRIGDLDGQIPGFASGQGFESQVKYDPTYGWVIPDATWKQIQAMAPDDPWAKLGPALFAGGIFAGPIAASLAAGGAGGAAAAGDAAASAGGTATNIGNLGNVASGGVNFADSFLPTLSGGASGGVNFADSFLPTLTEAGATGAANFGPLSSIGDMISGLSSGGSLISSGLGGVGAGLGTIAGGGVSGMGALTDILQTVGSNTGPLEFGAGGSGGGILDAIKSALGGSGGGGAAAGGGSALGNALGLGQQGSNLLDLLGNLAGAGLGIWNAQQQADAADDLYDRFFALGEPYRQQLADLNANPSNFFQSDIVQGALQQGSDALARSLSAKVGNPILNPTALQEMQNYTSRGLLDAYNNRFNQLASAGQLGVSQSAPLGLQAVNAQGDVGYTAGLGLKSVLGNQNNQAQQLGQALMRQFGLT